MKLVELSENDWVNPELVEHVRAVENESLDGFLTVVYMCSGAAIHYRETPAEVKAKLARE
jgi:hypothetical protein